MGMDFNMIMEHSLSIKEIANLSEDENLWNSLDVYLKSALNYSPKNKYVRWTQEPSKDNLNEFWVSNEKDLDYNKFMEIDCYFGCITVYRKTVHIWFSTIFYSYKFFHNSEHTRQIMNLGRVFAKYFRTNKILYLPDGYRKTSIIEDYASREFSLDKAIEKGIKQFGEPPQGISKGRKNYFFIDYADQEIGDIKEWDEEEDFWRWNESKSEYEQI
jgi:hypothetical protein